MHSEAGLVLEFNPGAEHGRQRAKLLDLVQDRRTEWEFISTHARSSPASAWTGTHVFFEISERGPLAILDVRRSGRDEESEYFGFCNLGWNFILNTLSVYQMRRLPMTLLHRVGLTGQNK